MKKKKEEEEEEDLIQQCQLITRPAPGGKHRRTFPRDPGTVTIHSKVTVGSCLWVCSLYL